MDFQNKSIQCSECGTMFTFSADEQEQFASRGYTHEPKRCSPCRQAKKERMHVSNGNRFGNNSNGYRTHQELFSATCAECGRDTRVPFQPRTGRPVYCSDCYSKIRTNR